MQLCRFCFLALALVGCGRLGFEGTPLTCETDPGLCVDAGGQPDGSPPDARPDAEPDAEPDAAPIIPINVTVAPIVVSGAATCSTGAANLNRDIGVDATNYIYVVFECGGALTASVSGDGGASFTAPVDLGVTDVDSIAVAGGPAGVAYVAAATATTVELLKTTDFGQSWTTTTAGTAAGDAGFGVSLAVAGDSIYILRREGDMRVFANHNRGEGAFSSVIVTMASVFGDIVADSVTGDVFLVTDTPDLHIRRSSDGGLTFDAETNPPGSYFYSDWALADSTIFVAGSVTDFARIPVNDTMAGVVTGPVLNSAQTRSRAVAASENGAFFTTQADSATGELSLTHFPPYSDVGTTVVLPAGAGGSVVAASDTVALYLYTTGLDEVAVGVEVF